MAIFTVNIEEAIIYIATPRLSHNDNTGQINKTHFQLKKRRARIHEKYASLRNTKGFEKELVKPKVTEILEVPSTLRNSKAFRPKGTCAIVGDSMILGLKENVLSKKCFSKVKIFPWKGFRRYVF